jgi:hypothetical protein
VAGRSDAKRPRLMTAGVRSPARAQGEWWGRGEVEERQRVAGVALRTSVIGVGLRTTTG